MTSLFNPSGVFRFVGSIVDFPRNEYSLNITEFLTSDDESSIEYKSYRAGLIFLASAIGGIFAIWSLLLLWLKLNGNTVGCAAGRPFVQQQQNKNDKQITCNNLQDTTNDLSVDDSNHHHRAPNRQQPTTNHPYDDFMSTNPQSEIISIESSVRSESSTSSLAYDQSKTKSPPPEETIGEDSSVATVPQRPCRRERRTQLAFLTFGLLTIPCSCLIISLFYHPVTEVQTPTQIIVDSLRNVTTRLKDSVDIIRNSTEYSVLVNTNVSHRASIICPKFSAKQAQKDLGFDLLTILNELNRQKKKIGASIRNNVTELIRITSSIDEALDDTEHIQQQIYSNMWIVPSILLLLCTVVSITLFGVFLSRQRKSSRKMQYILSYTGVPMLFTIALCCWSFAIGLSLSSAMVNDVCLNNSPNTTAIALLESSSVLNNETFMLSVVENYVEGCQIAEPLQAIVSLKTELQKISSSIWKLQSTADSVGHEKIDKYCGDENGTKEILALTRDYGTYIATIEVALVSIIDALSCGPINQQYVNAVSLTCTNIADAVTWGFLLFLLNGIFLLILITLRASWLYEINDDKIFDETEVAENMIVDEHEEYLKYISKYKHEWEEYQGLDPDISNGNIPREHDVQSGSTRSLYNTDSDEVLNQIPTQQNNNDGIQSDGSKDSKDTEDTSKAYPASESNLVDTFDPYNSYDTQSQTTEISAGTLSFLSLKERDMASYDSYDTMVTRQNIPVLPPLLTHNRTGSESFE